MEIPKDIEIWLIYDSDKLEYVFKPNTPQDIKDRYYEFLESIKDFDIVF